MEWQGGGKYEAPHRYAISCRSAALAIDSRSAGRLAHCRQGDWLTVGAKRWAHCRQGDGLTVGRAIGSPPKHKQKPEPNMPLVPENWVGWR